MHPHLVALELLREPPVEWLCVDMLADGRSVQQDVGDLVIDALSGAGHIALGNHTQERLMGTQCHLVVGKMHLRPGVKKHKGHVHWIPTAAPRPAQGSLGLLLKN